MVRTFFRGFEERQTEYADNEDLTCEAMEVDFEQDSQEDSEAILHSDLEESSTSENSFDGNGTAEDEEYSDIRLRSCKDKSLQFLLSSCLNRCSQADFSRFVSSLDDGIADEVSSIWMRSSNTTTEYNLCNRQSVVIKFVRAETKQQIAELVKNNLESILKLRNALKEDQVPNHNLASPYFRQLFDNERTDQLLLSVLLSVDGVSVKGNRNKIWPISGMILDLPSVCMQKSTNLVVVGIAEGTENPSTNCWNSLLPLIIGNIENESFPIAGRTVSASVVNIVADQMAKRPLFGFRGHSSAYSCFYCLDSGTMYKKGGPERHVHRPDDLTLDDAREGIHGFGPICSDYLKIVLPYNTPIDILHIFSEGIYEKVLTELLPLTSKGAPNRKSDLFDCDRLALKLWMDKYIIIPAPFAVMKKRRNGTDKCGFFRIFILLAGLLCSQLSAKCRLVLLSLALPCAKMYSNAKSRPTFYQTCCDSAKKMLSESAEAYFSIKLHEGLLHLPRSDELLGNNALLSTYPFESFYQFALAGYSTRKTRGFVKSAVERCLFQGRLRRELQRRLKEEPTESIRKYCNLVRDLLSPSISQKYRITLLPDDDHPESRDVLIYGVLTLPIGKLISAYVECPSQSEYFFGENGDVYKFIGCFSANGSVRVLAEEIEEITATQQFGSIREAANSLDASSRMLGIQVVEELLGYQGISNGRLSGRRIVLDVERISGMAAFVGDAQNGVYLQLNGSGIHN